MLPLHFFYAGPSVAVSAGLLGYIRVPLRGTTAHAYSTTLPTKDTSCLPGASRYTSLRGGSIRDRFGWFFIKLLAQSATTQRSVPWCSKTGVALTPIVHFMHYWRTQSASRLSATPPNLADLVGSERRGMTTQRRRCGACHRRCTNMLI